MIEKLRQVLKQEDTVLFIGSGVSLWSGLPSWTGLIKELIDFIKENGLDANLTEQELKRGDLLQAASYGFDKLTKSQFAQFIRNASRLGIAQPHEIHSKITELGPNCYITTNYDKLLELSFQKWKSHVYFRTVVNTQLTETAEIVGARSNGFLFKLHGDAENSDSIILTREQYRALNPSGELNHALETAKTLMLSRPIVYIGFGLRDPDFIYLKDLLFNTYKGGARDHYAIMADIGEQEKDYWRRKFGIHLIGYQTISKSDGEKDHTPILKLLDSLKASETKVNSSAFDLNSEFILSLNRHAAKYYGFETSRLHLPLVVHPIKNAKRRKNHFRFFDAPIEELLDNGPDKFILTGLPGGGKSYSFKASVARLSKGLSIACIEDSLKVNETIIPIYVDLKLYEGDLVKLIEQNIPVGMNLSILCSNFKVKLYLDAFNEVPKEFIELKSWNSDFSNLLKKHNISLVISSRTIDGLEELEFPAFKIDSIDEEFVKTSLAQNKLELKGVFRNEIIALLQKPFFYKLIFENKFKIETETSPKKIYTSLLNLINKRLNERFNTNINLLEPLASVALAALNNGEEAIKIEILIKLIESEVEKINDISVSSLDVINWLVSQDFLIPLVNERICFFHQSVTEYLAATNLASLFADNNKILKEKLSYRRWDQALFLCLSLLKKEEADQFLETIIEVDFELALSAVKYLEVGTKEVVERLLKEINTTTPKDWEWQYHIGNGLRYSLPIEESHFPILKQLVHKGNTLGGAATSCLIDLQGASFKDEVFNLLVDYCNDYNFCSNIGRSIKEYVTEEDIPKLLALCQKVQQKLGSGKINEFKGFDSALGDIIEDFNPEIVFSSFYDRSLSLKDQAVQLEVLFEYLGNCRNNEGLKMCLELLSAGLDKIAFQIHLLLYFAKDEDNIDYSIIESKHVNTLISIFKMETAEHSDWALSSLHDIFSKREDLKSIAEVEINKSNGVLKAALCYLVTKSEQHGLVFQALEELLMMDTSRLQNENFDLLSRMESLDWIGHEILFVKLLKLRNLKLAYNLCHKLVLGNEDYGGFVIDIGPINWWLEWFTEIVTSNREKWIFTDRVASVIASHISKDKRQELILEFNNPNSFYRKILSEVVLTRMPDLKLEDFTQESLSYLFEELNTKKIDFLDRSILSDIATEQFVNERMVPFLKSMEGTGRMNLEKLIERIGKKHKRRYLV